MGEGDGEGILPYRPLARGVGLVVEGEKAIRVQPSVRAPCNG